MIRELSYINHCFRRTSRNERPTPLPELPEVETLRRGLERSLTGQTIHKVRILVPKMLKGNIADSSAFESILRWRKIENIGRRGKHLIFRLDCGYYLLLHLKMRGQLLIAALGDAEEKYLAAALEFENGCELRFHDMWTWGELRLLTETEFAAHDPLKTMGQEPLGPEWTPKVLEQCLSRHPRAMIKALLLDQRIVAGVGNIYADESLFRAGINPIRTAGSLNEIEIWRLYHEVKAVLTEAIEGGGTTSDNYVDTNGQAGRYTPRVYDRAGQPCVCCKAALVRTKVAGRGTTYCPSCQH
jgi:formamidopyrimidine-DNA glycosylase